MAYEHLELERDGYVATIRLNRPERLNALNAGLVHDLNDALDELDAAFPDVRAIILTGNGRGFCSGADLTRAIATANGEEARPAYDPRAVIQALAPRIRRQSQPVIAAVNGLATGAGFSITLACDIRIASAEARFASIFVKRGIAVDTGSSASLPDLVGLGVAAEMSFTGRLVDAEWALAKGLVNSVVPHDQLMDAAMALAQEIAANPPLTVRSSKALMVRRFRIEDAIPFEDAANSAGAMSEDRIEAMRAFAEKRDPVFRGR
jgi:2-(1,2-epoxy-1,2-dihydrophenyl)acetyl-CoA isomerase